MKVLYFTAFYPPEPIAGAFRAAENARLWAADGLDITVFTGYPNYPAGKVFDGYQVKLLDEEAKDGVRILRSRLVARPTSRLITRLINTVSFLFFGLVNFIGNRKKIGADYDLVLGSSGPIFTGILAWIYAAAHHIPFLFEIRDITYRQMMAAGGMGKAAKLMRSLELFLCRRAEKVVVVTNGFKELLKQDGIPGEKIEVITNGVDTDITPHAQTRDFVLSYFGTLGISQNIMDTMPYAEELSRLCRNFTYLIIGEGAQREQIAASVAEQKLDFVTMLRGMSMESLEPYYARTLLSVITLKKSDNFRFTLPSKLFQVMGRGIAVLFIGPDGEAADLVRTCRSGLVLTGSPEENKAILREFFSRPDWEEALKEMGMRGAEAVKLHYSRAHLARVYEDVLFSSRKHSK